MDTGAFDLQEIKRVRKSFYVLKFLEAKTTKGMHQVCIEKIT